MVAASLTPNAFQRARNTILFGAAYFALAALTVRYTRFEGGVAFIWIANALLVASLLGRPMRRWPSRLAASAVAGAVATAFFGFGPVAALPFVFVNLGEALLGVALVRRYVPNCCRFDSLGEIAAFLAIFGAVAPAVSGVLAATIAHLVASVPFAQNWLNYVAGHGLGAITFIPLFILAGSGNAREWVTKTSRRDWLEIAGLFIAISGTSLVVFSQIRLPLLFIPLLPMMIAVFRRGRLGAAMSISLLTVIAAIFTARGLGPISLIDGSDGLRAQFLQFFLATAVAITLPAAAELKRRKQLFTQLQESSALYRLILDRTGDIVMRMEIDGTLNYVSPSILAIAGYQSADLLGRKPHEIIHADDVDEVIRIHRQALSSPNETFIVEYRARLASGVLGWFETHTRATVDEAGKPTGVVSILREVTRRKEAERTLAMDATTDALTGLLNRRAFDGALGQQIRAYADGGESFSIAIFDLDHFKSVNDSFGHATGDLVLRVFADLLRATVRDQDIVARLGGEEFIAILNGAEPDQAQLVCERVRAVFAELACIADDGRTVRATVSGGIATMWEGAKAIQLFNAADEALYRAKSSGRNRLALAA